MSSVCQDNETKGILRRSADRVSRSIKGHYSKLEGFIGRLKHPLLTLVLIGLVVRIILIPFSFNADMRYWGWIVDIIDNDLGLYDTDGYYYTPVWGYVLALSTFFGKLIGITDYGALVSQFVPYMSESYSVFEYVMSIGFSFVVKMPLIVTDIIVGLLLRRFVKRLTGDDIKALMAFALWFFCPLVILESDVHGMMDNISALFLLLTVMLAYDRNYFCAGVSFSFSMLVKIFPICFAFLFIVWVFKKEGWNYDGLKKLAITVAGSIVGFVVLNIPSILSNNIWETMRFLTDRLGTSTSTFNDILPISRIAIILVALLIITTLIWIVFKKRLIAIREKIRFMDQKKRDKIAVIITFAMTGLFAVLVAAYSVISISKMGDVSFSRFFESVAMKIMIIVALVSVALSFFIAYRFAFSGELDDKKLFTSLMLTSSFLFIWMPLPQYPIAIIPMMVLYVIIVDRRFLVPFILFTVCMSLYEISMGGITAFFSVASFTDLPIMEPVLAFLDFYTSKSFFIQPSMIFIGLFGAIAYVSMIYIPFKWLRENNWGRLR